MHFIYTYILFIYFSNTRTREDGCVLCVRCTKDALYIPKGRSKMQGEREKENERKNTRTHTHRETQLATITNYTVRTSWNRAKSVDENVGSMIEKIDEIGLISSSCFVILFSENNVLSQVCDSQRRSHIITKRCANELNFPLMFVCVPFRCYLTWCFALRTANIESAEQDKMC